ncbi:DUF1990 family protein [Nocardia harenae]|uniref:DUF1990 family protein n=1 Tax=Nocardia harenae TaxID=358707 RepID=UPI00082D178E|nr:DUF1990 domain-containing protein [Nocardia harenae]
MPDAPFTYPDVGATRGPLPAGYDHLEVRRAIAKGEREFRRLGDAVLAYRMQRGLGIFRSADTPVAQPGSHITVRLGVGPLGIPAPCRVVYVLDEGDRRGFAYGTLPGHPESGEELFAVEYDRATDTVHGVVTAFSRPAAWYTRLAGPAGRFAQRTAAAAYLATLRRTPAGWK